MQSKRSPGPPVGIVLADCGKIGKDLAEYLLGDEDMQVGRQQRRVAPLLLVLAVLAPLFAAGPAWCAERAPNADGQWKERSQLVWDKSQRTMVRRTFIAWDPHPQLDLDFLWKGTGGSADHAGIISGDGQLVWLAKGAAAYDRKAVFSDYEGSVRNGRPDGSGRLKLSSGQVYDGEWRDGQMSGKGTLRFANGDQYSGSFVASLPDGIGRYVAVDGTVFEGHFSKGMRDGAGTLTLPDGRAFRSQWLNDKEIARAPLDARPLQLVQAGGVRVNVYIDQKLNQNFKSADQDLVSYAYKAVNMSGALRIQLNSAAIMDLWKGNATIHADEEQWTPDLFIDPGQFAPLFLVVEIANEGGRTAQVDSVYFDLAESKSDLEPYVVVWGPGSMEGAAQAFFPQFTLKNYGWGAVNNARLTYAFGDKSGPVTRTAALDIGSFDQDKDTTVLAGLKEMGVDVDKLQRDKFKCLSSDEHGCLTYWINSGILGEVGKATFIRGQYVFTRIWGKLEYDWTDVSGASNHRVSPVSIDIPLIYIGLQAEMGSPYPVERGFRTIKLPLDKKNLHIPVNYKARLAPGETKRFALNFVAEKSSEHRFRFVFTLADGSTVTSPMIDLTYFIPRVPTFN